MQRGEIWLVDLPEPAGRHPAVILSRNKAVQVREFVTVAEVTGTIRHIPVEVLLHKSDGMSKECVVNLDSIYTISKKFLLKKITDLNPTKVQAIETALKYALDLK